MVSDESGGSGRHWFPRVLIAFAVLLSAGLLYRALARYDPGEIFDSIGGVERSHLFTAIGWAAASYLCLTLNDFMALRYVGKPLSYRYTALTSFVALAFGHNVGFAALSSGAIRYRFYSVKGLGSEELAKIIVFCGTTIFLGMFVLGDAALLFRPEFGETMTGLSQPAVLGVGIGLLAFPIAYLLLSWRWRTPKKFFRWSIEMPGVGLAFAQLAVGTMNFMFVAACLYSVMSSVADVGYVEVLAAFVIANTATIVTHTPGGLGVIEVVVTLLLRRPDLVGAVLLFRFVYYLLPLAVGAIGFALAEAQRRRA